MSDNSILTSNLKEQEQRVFNNHETQILYELRGILNAVESINRTISDAIKLTSSGGELYDAQRRANIGLNHFKKLMETKK
ncbi:15108_t:CDS:2 [Funneliformis geosporum]|uniref:5795_t:CDS:1 n=1 Tax=Funneliformis geosporum TaxID=1117311 RepID=A0A9W4SMH6_9GLOM|nr:15108_t:CDS:2 [Funneliformis geosporum]CAI2175551.1 5795_t:CDS:2 [Funneliformis geosporum]